MDPEKYFLEPELDPTFQGHFWIQPVTMSSKKPTNCTSTVRNEVPANTVNMHHHAVLRIRIRIQIHRIHMFLGLPDPDPDPLVRDMDPDPDPALDPDPSIIVQK